MVTATGPWRVYASDWYNQPDFDGRMREFGVRFTDGRRVAALTVMSRLDEAQAADPRTSEDAKAANAWRSIFELLQAERA